MRITLILLLAAMYCVACLAACNNNPEPAAPSTKAVDSAAAAAPDTIKPIPIDSIKR
jgi:hypothetical protein